MNNKIFFLFLDASKNGSKTCEKCRAGTESSFSHTTCIPCPPGTSNPEFALSNFSKTN